MSDEPFIRQIAMPDAYCPYCNELLDAAWGAAPGSHPREGDCTVCAYCAQIVIFRADLSMRRPMPGELAARFKADPKLHRLLRAMVKHLRRK